MSTALRDERGCLSDAGLEALRLALPGQGPPELAQHVSGCARCQDRLLAADLRAGAAQARARRPPPLWRILALFVLGFVLALVGFWWIGRLLRGEV